MNYLIKRAFILFVFSILTTSLIAQYGPQFPNRGFEDWTTRAESSVSEPVHWHSGGTATGSYSGMIDSQIESAGHPRPGSSGVKCVKLFPDRILGVTANGNMTNGRMNAGSMSASGSGNYNYTQRSQSAYCTSINQVPDSISVWVCFRSQSTTYKAQVKAVVHGDADYKILADGSEDPSNMHVATAVAAFNRTSTAGGPYNWQRLSIPFVNNGPCTDPRYILMAVTTNQTPGSGNTDDDLLLDDILLIYNPTLRLEQLVSHSFAPNNAITIPFTLTGTMSPDNLLYASSNVVIAQLSDANGSFSNPTELGRVTTNTSGSISAHIPAVADGNYSIRVISTNYPMVGENIQQVNISVPTYTVTVTANPSNGGTVSGSGTYQQGGSCTVTATPATGYTFTNWTENGAQVSTNPNYTFTVNANHNLVANFTINTYSIAATADPSAGGTVSGAGTYDHGESCTLSASAHTGYTFTNWTENGNVVSTNANFTFTVTGTRTLVAHFTLNTYNIAVTADPSAGGTVSGAGTYNHGESCTVSASAHTGYTFANWTENGDVVSTNANYTFTVTNARTLVAHFTLNTYTISVAANPTLGGTVYGAGTYNHGESCTVSATAHTGFTFASWTEGGNVVSTDANYTFTVTGNRNLVARFTYNTYTIAVSANPSNGGSVTGGGTYDHGQNCMVSATAAPGYSFSNWTENGNVVSTNASYSFSVTADHTLVANFTLNNYTVSVSANPSDGGTVTGGGTFTYGQSCTVNAIPAHGYTFINWTDNGSFVSSNTSYTFSVNTNHNLVAHFTINPQQNYFINVSANPIDGGTVIGSGIYQEGQSCTVSATPATGYTFDRWTENEVEVSTDERYTFTVTSDRTLVAQFSIMAYDINVTAEPNEGGTVSGSGSYNYGESCTITATANEGYVFIEWTKDDIQVSTDSCYTFTVTASETYVAHFHLVDDNVEEHVATSQIFPNPFTSSVSIKSEKTIKSISVYDIYGRLVKEQIVSDMEIELDMSDLSNGAYLLQLDYGDSRSVHRIMKIRK